MNPTDHPLGGGKILRIRDAVPDDAPQLLEYIEIVSCESDFLSFGEGEFEMNELQLAEVLGQFFRTRNQMYVLGLIDEVLVSALFFEGGSRPRLRHVGEFGMTVRQEWWRMGVGQLMLDTMIEWAEWTGIVQKIDLRVRVDNLGAIRMYERAGFVREGTITDQMLIGGVHHDAHVMGRAIEPK